RRIHEPNCKDCLTVFRLGGAILPEEGEHLPAIDRRIGEIPDLKLLEAAPRHSLCAGLMTRRLNFVPRTVNLTIRKLNLTVLRTEDLMLGGVKNDRCERAILLSRHRYRHRPGTSFQITSTTNPGADL